MFILIWIEDTGDGLCAVCAGLISCTLRMVNALGWSTCDCIPSYPIRSSNCMGPHIYLVSFITLSKQPENKYADFHDRKRLPEIPKHRKDKEQGIHCAPNSLIY